MSKRSTHSTKGRTVGYSAAFLLLIGVLVAACSGPGQVQPDPAPSPEYGAAEYGPPVAAPEHHTYTLKVEGTVEKVTINYGVGGSVSTADATPVPWSKTMSADGSPQEVRPIISASTSVGSGAGTLTCSITDETGRVLAQDRGESEGGSGGYASASCFL